MMIWIMVAVAGIYCKSGRKCSAGSTEALKEAARFIGESGSIVSFARAVLLKDSAVSL
jgi:hypothetical protein